MEIVTRLHFFAFYRPESAAEKRTVWCRENVITDGGVVIGKPAAQPADLTVGIADFSSAVHAVTDQRTGQTIEITGAMVDAWLDAEFTARQAADDARIAAEKAAQEKNHA